MERTAKNPLRGRILSMLVVCLFALPQASRAQNFCNNSGNLMLYTNYDGGTLTINVDQNISNIKIGVCSYEAIYINLTGAFVSNVTEVRYAGYNGTGSNNCYTGPTTTIVGAGSAATSTVFAPNSPLSNSNGWAQIICGYSCSNNTSQGGCNTVNQIEAYFLGYFSGSTLYSHKVQYNCWTGTQSVSAGGNCCPIPALLPGGVTGTQTVCSAETPQSLASSTAASGGAGTITYTWQSSIISASSGFVNISGANLATYQPSPLSVTTWFRRAASTPSNAAVYSNVLMLTANPTPSIFISSNSPQCMGETLLMTAGGAQTYVWTGPAQFMNFGANVSLPLTSTSASGVYTITALSAAGCSNVATTTVVVHPSPNITFTVSSGLICVGGTVMLSGAGGASYLYIPGSLSGSSVVVTPTTSTSYTMTGTDQNGCSSVEVWNVQVEANVDMQFTASHTTVCSGSSSTLTAIGPASVLWQPGGNNSLSIVVSPTASTVYSAQSTDQFGCFFPGTVSVAVVPVPTVTAQTNRTKICAGESSTLSALGAVSYQWLPGTQTTASLIVSPAVTTTYTVKGTGTNSCTNLASITVSVSECIGLADHPAAAVMHIYPNPSNGELQIEGISESIVRITTITGALVRILELDQQNGYSMHVRDLAPGLYLVTCETKYRSDTQKVLVTD